MLYSNRQQNGLLCNALPFIHMYVAAVHNTFIFIRAIRATRKEEKQNIPRPMCTTTTKTASDDEYNDSRATNMHNTQTRHACNVCGAQHVHGKYTTTTNRIYAYTSANENKIAIFTYGKCSAVRRQQAAAQQDSFYFMNKRASLPLFRYR